MNLSGRLVSLSLALLARTLPLVSPGHRSWLARQLVADRYAARSRILAGFFADGLMAWHNKQYDIHLNGEAALLQRLAPFAPKVLFDVGANRGDWSLAACAALPSARVHAFEIAPPTAALLEQQAAPLAGRLIVNRFGLLDRKGEVAIYFSDESDTATSLLQEAMEISAPDHRITKVQEIRAQVVTGDEYVEQGGIDRIDLLKIDVEGAEQAVLQGFRKSFERGIIDLVQFEYGKINLKTAFFLSDFYKFLEGYGYSIGKLYPEGVAFKPLTLDDEDFIGPNYVACSSRRQDLLAALSCPPLQRL